MIARNKYIVEYTDRAPMTVYADKISITEDGSNVIFYQLRKTAAIDDNGIRICVEALTVVMILRGSFSCVYSASANDSPHYAESGSVELIN